MINYIALAVVLLEWYRAHLVRAVHAHLVMCVPPSVCMSHPLHPSLLTCSIDQMEEAEARLARLWRRAVVGQLDLEAARRMVKMTVINICSIHQGPKTSGRGTL